MTKKNKYSGYTNCVNSIIEKYKHTQDNLTEEEAIGLLDNINMIEYSPSRWRANKASSGVEFFNKADRDSYINTIYYNNKVSKHNLGVTFQIKFENENDIRSGLYIGSGLSTNNMVAVPMVRECIIELFSELEIILTKLGARGAKREKKKSLKQGSNIGKMKKLLRTIDEDFNISYRTSGSTNRYFRVFNKDKSIWFDIKAKSNKQELEITENAEELTKLFEHLSALNKLPRLKTEFTGELKTPDVNQYYR